MPGTKLSPELSKELRASSRSLKKKKGVVLFRAGARARGVFIVRTGRLKLQLDGAAGLYPPRILGPGSLVGLPATISGEPYSLAAAAVQDCELDFIPRKDVLSLIRRNTKAALQILQILSEEIYQMRNTVKATMPTKRETIH